MLESQGIKVYASWYRRRWCFLFCSNVGISSDVIGSVLWNRKKTVWYYRLNSVKVFCRSSLPAYYLVPRTGFSSMLSLKVRTSQTLHFHLLLSQWDILRVKLLESWYDFLKGEKSPVCWFYCSFTTSRIWRHSLLGRIVTAWRFSGCHKTHPVSVAISYIF